MRLVKINLAVSAIAFVVSAIFLIWNEDVVTCGVTICKVLETILIIVSVLFAKYIGKL